MSITLCNRFFSANSLDLLVTHHNSYLLFKSCIVIILAMPLLSSTDEPDNIQFTTLTLKPRNGNAVALSCSSNGKPTPKIRIYKITGSSSRLITEGGSYSIPNINYVDYTGYKAIFRCASNNTFGSATKDIQLDVQGKIFKLLRCFKNIFMNIFFFLLFVPPSPLDLSFDIDQVGRKILLCDLKF